IACYTPGAEQIHLHCERDTLIRRSACILEKTNASCVNQHIKPPKFRQDLLSSAAHGFIIGNICDHNTWSAGAINAHDTRSTLAQCLYNPATDGTSSANDENATLEEAFAGSCSRLRRVIIRHVGFQQKPLPASHSRRWRC